MKRWAFNVAAALSLLLCVASTALWVRSYRGGDDLAAERLSCFAASMEGRFAVGVLTGSTVLPGPWGEVPDAGWVASLVADCGRDLAAWEVGPGGEAWSGLAGLDVFGEQVRYGSNGPTVLARWQGVVVPYWLTTAATAALPAARAIRRRRRRATGHCTHCGYDLRATPGRCPECGAAVTQCEKEVGT